MFIRNSDHDFSNRHELDVSFNSLFELATKNLPKLHITGSLCWETIDDKSISLTKSQ